MNKIINDKKGFTLVELLAVIIIISVIALITVPVITDVLDDAEETTAKRSVDLFAKSFKAAVSESTLNGVIIKTGKFTTDDGHTFADLSGKTLNVTYNGDAVKCSDIELYSDGNLYLSDCQVGDYELKNYIYGVKQDGEL